MKMSTAALAKTILNKPRFSLMEKKPSIYSRKSRRVLTVETVYYFEDKVVMRTFSKHANSAVKNSLHHMQMNDYHATHCEVYDSKKWILHAVIVSRLVNGELVINTLIKRKVKGRKNDV
jgi:hypothetical protein